MPYTVDLTGKVAIVTGAGRYNGIGRGIALALADAGADVVVTARYRSPETYPEYERALGWRGVESVAEEIRAMGRRALPLWVDVADRDQVIGMVERTLAEFGRIDILVNNAAAPRGRDRVPVVDLEEDAWDEVLRVNLTGTFLCSKYVAQVMVRQGQGGKIINISSIAGRRGNPRMGAYSTSKFGLQGFTQVLAMELAPAGINVNAVCPGLIETERMSDWGAYEAGVWGVSLEEARRRVIEQIPLRRTGTVEDVANLVVFLASDRAGYITGQTINVCGGRVLS